MTLPARLSRRTLLRGAAAACAAAAAGTWRWLSDLYGPPALDDTAPGPLAEGTLATLVAVARSTIGMTIEPSHYAEYFRWRAAHLRGYRSLYERFAAEVGRETQRRAGCAFAACEETVRRQVLEAARRARAPRTAGDAGASRGLVPGGGDVLWRATGGRAWAAYDEFILREALAVFADTDAWVKLGYDGWPGTARGLDRYTRAPA